MFQTTSIAIKKLHDHHNGHKLAMKFRLNFNKVKNCMPMGVTLWKAKHYSQCHEQVQEINGTVCATTTRQNRDLMLQPLQWRLRKAGFSSYRFRPLLLKNAGLKYSQAHSGD